MEQMYNSKTLWQDFSPTSEALDVNVLETVEADGIIEKRLYFTGRATENSCMSRVYAVVCSKSVKQSKSAVLVVGDYKKTIETDVLRDFAERGFVAMSIDFPGRRDKGIYTIYPFDLDYCNADVAPDMFELTDTAKETKFYEYALNCMRAVTYLIEEEKAAKVSLVTSGIGSYIGLIALGVDKRIVNGAVLFGSLNKIVSDAEEERKVDLSDEEKLNEHLEQSEKAQKWTVALSPQAYALQIDVPLYVVNSANSMLTDVVEVNKMYYRINDDSRMLILPLSIDFMPSEYAMSVIKWLKSAEIPKEEELSSFYDNNGDYNLKLKTKKKKSQISIWYCTNPESHAKYWKKADVKEEEQGFSAKLDLYEQNCEILAFAVLDGDVAISTPIFREKVTVVNVKNPNNIIFIGNGSQDLISLSLDKWWNVVGHGNLAKGYLDIVGMKGRSLATYALNDKSVRRSLSLAFSFDVCSSFKQTLYVSAVCVGDGVTETYRQQVELTGDGKWTRVTISGEKFRRVDDGKSLSEKKVVDLLIIHAENDIIVNNICLV